MLAQLRQEHPRITEAGARAVAVFQGAPAAVGEYCRDRDIPFECMSDPGHEAYPAFGLGRAGVATWLSPNTILKGLKLFRRGITTGLPHAGQDVRQLPGTFVVERGGRVRLAHYSRDPADNPSVELILGSLGAS